MKQLRELLIKLCESKAVRDVETVCKVQGSLDLTLTLWTHSCHECSVPVYNDFLEPDTRSF